MDTSKEDQLLAPVPHPYASGEQPLPPLSKMLLPLLWLLLAILFPFRLVLLVFSVCLSTIVCSIVTFGLPPNTLTSPELTGWRRTLMRSSHYVIGRLCMIALGVWPGLLSVEGQIDKRAPVIVFGPHVGLLDGLFWLHYCAPRPVILETYTKIPGLSAVFNACSGLAVPIPSSKRAAEAAVNNVNGNNGDGDPPSVAADRSDSKSPKSSVTGAIRAAIVDHKRKFVPGQAPIVLLPEGITHNGLTLLKFFPGSFEGGSPVQGVVLSYPFTYFNSHAFLSDVGTHMFKMLCSPYISLKVTILPLHVPSEEEKLDPSLMAENVRGAMAEVLQVPLSPYGAKEIRMEWKAAKQPAA